MADLDLFPKDHVIGVFRGFHEGGLEFHADLVLPYRSEFQNLPMHGQFLLVQLETPHEAVLGRIASLSAEGKLSAGAGEEFSIRAMQESRPIPEDLRQQYLKYRVDIRVLGVLRSNSQGGLTFVPSHRRLPHVGSLVAFPSDAVLQEIVGHNLEGAPIGHYALGEYLYAQGTEEAGIEEWMQVKGPEALVRFPVHSLVARRSFIFARAGFGKSNLNKLLFSRLYEETPTVAKRGGRQVPVGTVLFDPDGEYFWPDDRGRPGLCDVPALRDKLVVFTSRKGPSPFYDSFVAGGIKLDIRRFKPADVIAIALNLERQEQQNVRKLRELSAEKWSRLVTLIDKEGNQAPLGTIREILGLEPQQDMEALAARGNMTAIVRMLHSPSSQLLDMLLEALSQGKLCVVDVSQMRGSQALVLSGLILRQVFDRNQEQFTAASPQTIPTIAVVEEAQTVLREGNPASEPYIAWVKEGRKYDLGAVLVTQQPGSLPAEILSQGDNWFLFHLLSAGDLVNVKRANAHFSDDLLGALLNEPIPGQGVFWSSVGGKPYPVAFRALSFERRYRVLDPDYSLAAGDTFARKLRGQFAQVLAGLPQAPESRGPSGNGGEVGAPALPSAGEGQGVDVMAQLQSKVTQAIGADKKLVEGLRSDGGASFKWLFYVACSALPPGVDRSKEFVTQLIRGALCSLFGAENEGWENPRHPSGKAMVRAKRT